MKHEVHGFALVELLVVIGIIGMLMALLLPIFAHARAKAWDGTCLSNQRQIAMALVMWAQDHDETLPDAATVWPDLQLDAQLLRCPAMRSRAQNSYAFNAAIGGEVLTSISDPTATVLTADGKSADNLANSAADLDPRHHAMVVAGYVDGHALLTPPNILISTGDLGQLIEGCGSADFEWLKFPGNKYGIAFVAPKSGAITQIALQWKQGGAYGSGNRGMFSFQLQTNGPGNFPSGTVLGHADNLLPDPSMNGNESGPFYIPISATLTAGQKYHLVVTDTDPSPGTNWSSPNTMMTRIVAWDGTGCRGEYLDGNTGQWSPWASSDSMNLFNVARDNLVNGAHSPLWLKWADNTYTGDPYYSAFVKERAYFYGALRAGEYFVWNQASVTIKRIGLPVGKTGAPGALRYHFEKIGAGELVSGTIATADQIGTVPTWVYANVTVPLDTGSSYRLWFDSPASPNQSNSYWQMVPYGDDHPAEWLECGWGGTAGCYTKFDGTTWSTIPAGDMSFSMVP